MNKCIKRLVESLFDDDFDDIVNHNDEVTTITREIMKIELPYCESYLSKHSSQCSGRGEHVYLETEFGPNSEPYWNFEDFIDEDYILYMNKG